MKTLKLLSILMLFFLTKQQLYSQCYPVGGPATVFGATFGTSGVDYFNNMPTGTVIELVAPYANTVFNISFCATNPNSTPNFYPSGTNDAYVTVLDANDPNANFLATGDDGCENIAAPGYGPPVLEFIAPTSGTFYLYLTEYSITGTNACANADGSNTSYVAEITTTLPPAVDVTLFNSTGFSKIPLSQKTAVTFSVAATNIGFNATTYNVSSNVYLLPGSPGTFITSSTQSIGGGDTSFNVAVADVSNINSLGDYNAIFIANANNDNIASNDTVIASFKITNDIYSRGSNNVLSNAISSGVPETLEITQHFTFSTPVLISEIFFQKVNAAPGATDSVQAIILSSNNDEPDTIVYASPLIPASSLQNGQVGIGIPNQVSLAAGKYFIGYKNIDNSATGVFAFCEDASEPNSLFIKVPSISAQWVSYESLGSASVNFCMDIQLTEDLSVGLNEIATNEVLLFPNPATNQVNIVLQNTTASTIEIYNIAGKLLHKEIVANNNQATVDVANFSNGMYIVEVTNQVGKVNRKLTINK